MKRYPAQASLFVSTFLVASLFLPSHISAADNYSFSAAPGGSGGQIELNWKQARSDVQSYNVFYGTAPGKYEFSAVKIGSVPVGKDISFNVNYLNPGQKYYFSLSPVSSGKATAPNIITTEAVSKEGPVTPPPTPPATQLTVSTNPTPTVALNSPVVPGDTYKGQKEIGTDGAGVHRLSAKKGDKPGEVALSWNKAFSNVDGYSVVYGTEPGNFQYGANNIGNTTSFTVKDLDPGKKYYFALVPLKGGKAQYISSQVAENSTPGIPENPPAPVASSETTTPANTPSLTGPVPEDSVKNQSLDSIKAGDVGKHHLTAKKAGDGAVTLEWSQAFKDTDNYDVVYGTEPGKFQYGALSVGKTTSFTVKGLDSNKNYYFALVPHKDGKAQYITQQVTSEGAGTATQAEVQNSVGGQSVELGSPSNTPNSGAPTSPTTATGATTTTTNNLPTTTTQTGKSGGQGSTQTTTGGGSGGSTGGSSGGSTKQETKQGNKQENKKDNKKDSGKKEVKGVRTVIPWFLHLFGF